MKNLAIHNEKMIFPANIPKIEKRQTHSCQQLLFNFTIHVWDRYHPSGRNWLYSLLLLLIFFPFLLSFLALLDKTSMSLTWTASYNVLCDRKFNLWHQYGLLNIKQCTMITSQRLGIWLSNSESFVLSHKLLSRLWTKYMGDSFRLM